MQELSWKRASTWILPGSLFGKPWHIGQSGIFRNNPTSPNDNPNPTICIQELSWRQKSPADMDKLDREKVAARLRYTMTFHQWTHAKTVSSPPARRPFTTKVPSNSLSGTCNCLTGVRNHKQRLVVLQQIKPGVTKGAVKWDYHPNVVADWMYQSVIQTSQIGYHPAQGQGSRHRKWIYGQ